MGKTKENRWLIFKDGKPIIPVGETYEADPFFLNGILFFELYNYDKGVIAIRKGDNPPEVVLERPYHLSFPCVFEDNGEYYMLPETVNSGQMELYKAKNFPYDWELVKVIQTGWFDDPILHRSDKYRIFTTEGENNLRVFEADSLLGEWHKVYADANKQYRSAGHIFEEDGKLIRPCQDCEERYGGGLIFYELDGFKHKEISRFTPDKPFTGCHTFNQGYIDARVPYEENLRPLRLNPDLRQRVSHPST